MFKKNQKTKGAEEVKESTEITIEDLHQSYDEAMKACRIARKEKAKEVDEKKKLYRRSVIKTTLSGILLPFLLISDIPETMEKKREYLEAKKALNLIDGLMKTANSLLNIADAADKLSAAK